MIHLALKLYKIAKNAVLKSQNDKDFWSNYSVSSVCFRQEVRYVLSSFCFPKNLVSVLAIGKRLDEKT